MDCTAGHIKDEFGHWRNEYIKTVAHRLATCIQHDYSQGNQFLIKQMLMFTEFRKLCKIHQTQNVNTFFESNSTIFQILYALFGKIPKFIYNSENWTEDQANSSGNVNGI